MGMQTGENDHVLRRNWNNKILKKQFYIGGEKGTILLI